jgi:hypothetical protein
MKHVQDYAEVFATRLGADRVPQKCPPAHGGKLIAFPRRTIHRCIGLGATEHGDDAGHCTPGLPVRNSWEATAEDQAIYRKWIKGMVVFYSALLLMAGIVAVLIDAGLGSTTSPSLAARSTAVAHRTK